MAKYDMLFDEKVERAADNILLSFPAFNAGKLEAKQMARIVLLTAREVEEEKGETK